MRRRGRQWRDWAVFVAALVLLVHAAAAGFVDGAMASAEARDAFGNVICTGGGAERLPGAPGAPSDRTHAPDCCLAGCGAPATSALTPVAIALPVRFEAAPACAPELQRLVVCRLDRGPQNPRAPPVPA